MLGKEWAHLRVTGRVGEGGMGVLYEVQDSHLDRAVALNEVYRARDMRLNRGVANKSLPTAFAKHSDRLRRFEREARTARSPQGIEH